jgi:hypothetical protein
MKLRLSSNGCKPRPAKGEPARAGSKPGAESRDGIGEAEACERAGRGTAAPKPIVFPDAEGPVFPEGNNHPLREFSLGKERMVSGGVFDHSTYEEDGPVTDSVG